jgi:hypothetical protein
MEKLIILGFDVRRPIAHQNSNWSGERRSKFLIRPDIRSPISVDPDVWPLLKANPDESYPLHLWGSVSDILAAFPEAARWGEDSPAILELATVATDEQSLGYWEGIFFGRVKPENDSAIQIASECLGCDVADRFLVSGLSNCMLSQEELTLIRKDWSKLINTWGLFDNSETAKGFRAVCNRLVPEHAPFETYRVRRVEIGQVNQPTGRVTRNPAER